MCLFFFFNDTATTEIYTLSLHDALPIWVRGLGGRQHRRPRRRRLDRPARLALGLPDQPADRRPRLPLHAAATAVRARDGDRKSTRLNSSHANISYAVFCLKKKKIILYNL